MDSEQNRSDDYWMGVRDALRMVDSFTKWSRANKHRAKPLEEFLHDGLVAAAKRCESCLHKQLGIAFSSEEAAKEFMETNDIYEESTTPSEEPEAILEEDEFEVTPPEIVLELEGEDSIEDVSIVIEPDQEKKEIPIFDDSAVSIDSMGSSDSILGDESLTSSGQPRDFSSDFDLVEPDPLIISSESDGIETPPSAEEEDLEDIFIEETTDDTELSSDDEEIAVERPRYDWDAHDDDSTDDSVSVEEPPAPAVPDMSEIPAPPKDWSPMDDPSPATLTEDEVSEESDELGDKETPPPPPPPPETEESEEERRRRARRLFFGA